MNIKYEYAKDGDLGAITMKYRVSQLFISKTQLSVEDVFEGMKRIAHESGSKSLST